MYPIPTFQEIHLHYLWKSLRFNTQNLRSVAGHPIEILHQGQYNHNQGPDFLHARIRIGTIEWNGHVEIHLNSQDWYRHRHEQDPHYNGVILHVVWESEGEAVMRADGSHIPELALAARTPNDAFNAFDRLWLSQHQIPCEKLLPNIPAFYVWNWIERMGIERINQKAQQLHTRLQSLKGDWDQLIWEQLATRMGGKVNHKAFQELGTSIPYSIIRHHSQNPIQLEALFFGFLRLLTAKTQDGYQRKLQQEWHFLQQKYQLTRSNEAIYFHRMRPAGFPTLRLAQLSSLLHHFPSLTQLLQPNHFSVFLQHPIHPSHYWRTHYRFGQSSSPKAKILGQAQKEVLLMNVCVPIGCLYAQAHGRTDLSEWIETGMSQLKAENNRITRLFREMGYSPPNALHSQGMIQLKTKHCDAKNCLNCGIGAKIL